MHNSPWPRNTSPAHTPITFHSVEHIVSLKDVLLHTIDAFSDVPQLAQIQLVDLFRAVVATLGVQVPDIYIAKTVRAQGDREVVQLVVKYKGADAELYGPVVPLKTAVAQAGPFASILREARSPSRKPAEDPSAAWPLPKGS